MTDSDLLQLAINVSAISIGMAISFWLGFHVKGKQDSKFTSSS